MQKNSRNIILSEMQKGAVQEAKKWFKSSSNQYWKLTGYAGTGKTTVVEYLINDLKINLNEVAFVAPTGKAALVITQKANGKYEAFTIHKLIYTIDPIAGFILKRQSDLNHIKLIIVDESSMIAKDLIEDLLSFGIKTLFLGDKGQLDPIGEKTDLLDNPDYELTEIHRQAKDNAIIYLSFLAREGKKIQFGPYGKDVYVFKKSDLDSSKLIELSMRADQVICGYNSTRKNINKLLRNRLGRTSPFPEIGDKMICLRNNWSEKIKDISLVNGMTGFITEKEDNIPRSSKITKDCMRVSFQPDFTEEKFENLLLLNDEFLSKKVFLDRDEANLYNSFDYGYAITCHKSQGSQYNRVLLKSEILPSSNYSRWLYTGITRAVEKLILIL
ncbi:MULTISPECIES: ATP-dependent DNA helicase [Bacillus]|uniref:ATP-dependent DNA helicase n=1 Tax=Bacillus TaxID=1386 RepID=UPI00077AC674|nr:MULTISPECIES: AAA family ATPase [Bacillus]KXY56675.1 hypothetical protein AT261_18930 [Bacillus cereus]MEB8804774.1 AAA family ATPase [Bacillus cereus]